MKPDALVMACDVVLPPPSDSDKIADADRLLRGLKSIGINADAVPLHIMQRLPDALRNNSFRARFAIGYRAGNPCILDFCEGRICGIAIDIGSTNIVCRLFDLEDGKVLFEKSAENPQAKYGPDVLTRVQLSMTGKYAVLRDELMAGINSLISEMSSFAGIRSDSIYAAVIAGNTIMSHFFLGLSVNNIPLNPYIPVSNSDMFLTAEEVGLNINKRGLVYVFPNSGSYVGGDIISGILYSGIYKEEDPVLFIDVGTNVEVTLGCKDWIMTGAGAAGPALEGGVAHIGKTAEPGTICRVRIDDKDLRIDMDVIAGGEPLGICGSGLIDLIAEMFGAGIIDQAGRLNKDIKEVIEKDGVTAYMIHRSSEAELYITEHEIRNFLLSKAAMFSFLYVFVKSVGLTFSDIRKVYVAGALGCGINPESAIRIGMLPDIERDRFVMLGNSSLGGAEMVLLNRELVDIVREIASKVTYREMNEDAELMNVLQGGMFIPHTEPGVLKG